MINQYLRHGIYLGITLIALTQCGPKSQAPQTDSSNTPDSSEKTEDHSAQSTRMQENVVGETQQPSPIQEATDAQQAELTPQEIQFRQAFTKQHQQSLAAIQHARGKDLSIPANRQLWADAVKAREDLEKAEAQRIAQAQNLPTSGTTISGRGFELIRMENGKPVYYATHNSKASISNAAAEVDSTTPYNLSGTGLQVGVWDQNACRTSHREFGGRASQQDGATSLSSHHTHVSGTVGASGVTPTSKGMASAVTIQNRSWSNDSSEMINAATLSSIPSTKIFASNHSYGPITGWEYDDVSGTSGDHWYGGSSSDLEDADYGQYDYWVREVDQICEDSPYYLPFFAAGNDRNDGPEAGDTVQMRVNNVWQAFTYDPDIHPISEHESQFHTIAGSAVAKNAITVGAVNDAVTNNSRDISRATMSSFSGWGPTDDGRVKPDIVANGVGLYSTDSGADDDYAYKSGTSMATPSATGASVLIQQQYAQLFSGNIMRASSLKGIIIHTADDIGNPGPDYSNGWGLMNTKAAVDHIIAHAAAPSLHHLSEDTLDASTASQSYDFTWDGESSALKFTLCWTDATGSFFTNSLNNPTAALENDLDIRIIAPNGQTLMPWVLDRQNPADNATTGDNTVDNVEQIIENTPQPGTYQVTISHKGLSSASQTYSLIVSGNSSDAFSINPSLVQLSSGTAQNYSPNTHSIQLNNFKNSTSTWTAHSDSTWLTLSSDSGTLAQGSSTTLTASIDQTIVATLTPHTHTATVSFTVDQSTVITRQFQLDLLPIEKQSADLDTYFAGSQIWNNSYLNDWSSGSNVTESLNLNILNYDHSGQSAATTLNGTSASLDGGVTTWTNGAAGSWTVEARIKFLECSNGFAFWIGTGSQRIIVDVYADRTEDRSNDSFSVSHNNEDGQFHIYRITHDADNQVYHVWRDNIRLTPQSGAPYDTAANDQRLLFGDTTRNAFGNNFNVEIDYIAYDQSGAFLPVGVDSDTDGIPDTWEFAHFLDFTSSLPSNDDDNDGRSNLEEYLANTNPNAPGSYFAAEPIKSPIDGDWQIVVPDSSSNRVYTLYRSLDLGNSDAWTEVIGSIRITGTDDDLTFDVDNSTSKAFYQVKVEVP